MNKSQSLTIPMTPSSGSVTISQIVAGSASLSQSTKSASINASLTITGNWVPANSSDPAPSNATFMEEEQASLSGSANDSSGNSVSMPGTITDDIHGQNGTGSVDDVKYIVATNGTFTINAAINVAINGSLSVSNGPMYYQNGTPYFGSCKIGSSLGAISVSLVNGNWIGPYYFHKGQYAQGVQSNPTTIPWYNNMAGDYPTGTDTYDSNNIFQLQETTKPFAESDGTIIPIWVWSGPNLPGGAAPPAFKITETTDAFAEDNTNGGGTDWDVDDKQGNTPIANTPNEQFVMDTKPNTTTVSSFNTPSGSVWGALGQPFDLTGYAFGYEVYPPYDYTVYVGMSADLASQ